MEHTEAIAARLRVQISELEAELDVHRRALAALGEGPEEESPDAKAKSEPLLAKNLGQARPRRRAAGKRVERKSAATQEPARSQPAVTQELEPTNGQDRENEIADPAPSSRRRAGKAAQVSRRSSRRRPANGDEGSGGSVGDAEGSAGSVGDADGGDEGSVGSVGDADGGDAGSVGSVGDGNGNDDVSADAVLRALRDGYRKPADIADHLGVPVPTVSRRLEELVETGRIRRRRS
jgi:CRP-like cAMP-binding protein